MKEIKKIVIFLGPPGCGKGSLSAYISKKISCFQLSTGNLCRKHVGSNTSIGKEIDFLLKSGKLIPDEVVFDMVKEELNSISTEVLILDGFPRTKEQAEFLHDFLKSQAFDFEIIRFEISEDLVVNRLSNRLICQNKECQTIYSLSQNSQFRPFKENECSKCFSFLIRRFDDEPAIIKSRLEDYYEKESEILKFYNKINQPIINIDASKPMSELFNEIRELIIK